MIWQQQIIAILLPAILQVESGGRLDVPDGAHGERGPYQLSERAWMDASRYLWAHGYRRPIWPWSFGVHDLNNSRVMAEAYLLRAGAVWKKHHPGRTLNLEILARLYNGGPRGPENPATAEYWARVRAEIVRQKKGTL